MRIIINVHLLCDDPLNRHVYADVQKEFKCTVIPISGMHIEDDAWDGPREVQTVILNPHEDYYCLEFDDHCFTLEQCERTKERYMSQGWK